MVTAYVLLQAEVGAVKETLDAVNAVTAPAGVMAGAAAARVSCRAAG